MYLEYVKILLNALKMSTICPYKCLFPSIVFTFHFTFMILITFYCDYHDAAHSVNEFQGGEDATLSKFYPSEYC